MRERSSEISNIFNFFFSSIFNKASIKVDSLTYDVELSVSIHIWIAVGTYTQEIKNMIINANHCWGRLRLTQRNQQYIYFFSLSNFQLSQHSGRIVNLSRRTICTYIHLDSYVGSYTQEIKNMIIKKDFGVDTRRTFSWRNPNE